MKKLLSLLLLLICATTYSQQLSKLEPYIAANDSSWVPVTFDIGNGIFATRKVYGRDLFRNVLDSLVDALMGKSDTGAVVFDTTTIYKVLASKADTGIIDDARLSGNVALKNALNTFLNQNIFQAADDTYTIRVGYDGSNYSDFRTYAGGTLLISSVGSNPSVRLGVGGNPILQASNTQVSVARLFRPSTTTPLDLGTDTYRWGNLFLADTAKASAISIDNGAFSLFNSSGTAFMRANAYAFQTATTTRMSISANEVELRRNLIFNGHNAYDIGSTTRAPRDLYVWRDIYAPNIPRTSTPLDSGVALIDGKMVYGPINGGGETDTSNLSARIDSAAAALAGKADKIGTIQTSQLTTQRSRNSTSWGDIEGLSFPILANKAYWFKFHIQYAGAAETTGAKFGITGPGTGVTTVHRSYVTDWDGSNWTDYKSPVLVSYDAGTNSFTSGSHLQPRNIAIVEGTISVGEDGVIQARFASEVGGSNITVQPWLSFVQFIQLN